MQLRIPSAVLVSFFWLLWPSQAAAQNPTVAIIGTGNIATAMGPKLAAAGYPVVYGSRDPSRASVSDLVELTGHGAYAATQTQAAEAASLVVLAVPWEAMEQVIENLGDLAGKTLIDVSGAHRVAPDGYLEVSVETSTSQVIQSWVPEAHVVKTGIPSAYMIHDPELLGPPPTVLLASDDREAKEAAGRLVAALGLDPFDAGPLRMAEAVESLGLIFWVPLLQGRDQGIEFRLMRSSYWPCSWDVQAAFGAPHDVDDLAALPGQGTPRPCDFFSEGR